MAYQCTAISSSSSEQWVAKDPRVVNAPISMALQLLLVVSFFVAYGADSSTMSSHSFF
jgi:hypothetical protein